MLRAMLMAPTLLRCASAITERKKCCGLSAQKFYRFQTWRDNSQQHATTCNMVQKRTQHATPKNIENCWPTMLRPFANSFILEIVSASVFKFHKVCVTNRSKRPYDVLIRVRIHRLVQNSLYLCKGTNSCEESNEKSGAMVKTKREARALCTRN